MATATVSKKFPVKTGAPQIKWILKKKGPLTVWEIIDFLKSKDVVARYGNVERSLIRLREKEEAGVVNYKMEDRRRKKGAKKYDYREFKYGWYEDVSTIGESIGGQTYAAVWGLVNDSS